jgi:7,8-dihydropterin-6-yl-methyl-4-(beta-D-ribofuranosyl)aminobenzene 5'-phosphate synthase
VKVLKISKKTMHSVERLKITVLVEDSLSARKRGLKAKHGLSLLIETRMAGVSSRILMDTGPTPDMVLQNAGILDVDLRNIDLIFLSHGHYDHTGGLIEILKHANKPVPVVAHPRAFNPKFVYKPSLKSIGPRFNQSLIDNTEGTLVLARNPVKIIDGVITSGEIPRENLFEKVKDFWTTEDDQFVKDSIIDDEALFINVMNKGLITITGCAHSGIINTIEHGKKITGINNIYAVLGGLHLEKADESRIQTSVDELSRINPRLIYPCHCTGSKAVDRLRSVFGERCTPIHTGDVIEL